jgi:Ca-activated chloride channel family protein
MTFAWPLLLLLPLIGVPLLVAAYHDLTRRRADRRVELEALGLVAAGATAGGGPRASAGRRSAGRRRHVVPALFLLALTLLLIALARPQTTITEPRREGTVVLAFDTSGSMAAPDLRPTRMEAAKAAARTFVERQPATIRLGVVAFGESGLITQQPTTDRVQVLAAIDRLAPTGGTALGRGIQTSLSAIAGRTVRLDAPEGGAAGDGGDVGYYGSSAVVLLSDGENTDGPNPQDAADLASTAGVKVYPIGLGSAAGTVLEVDGFQIATALDEPVLRQIAETTNGRYFNAADEKELAEVYGALDLSWTLQGRKTEVTALFAAAAALLLILGAGLSFAWYGRVI